MGNIGPVVVMLCLLIGGLLGFAIGYSTREANISKSFVDLRKAKKSAEKWKAISNNLNGQCSKLAAKNDELKKENQRLLYLVSKKGS